MFTPAFHAQNRNAIINRLYNIWIYLKDSSVINYISSPSIDSVNNYEYKIDISSVIDDLVSPPAIYPISPVSNNVTVNGNNFYEMQYTNNTVGFNSQFFKYKSVIPLQLNFSFFVAMIINPDNFNSNDGVIWSAKRSLEPEYYTATIYQNSLTISIYEKVFNGTSYNLNWTRLISGSHGLSSGNQLVLFSGDKDNIYLNGVLICSTTTTLLLDSEERDEGGSQFLLFSTEKFRTGLGPPEQSYPENGLTGNIYEAKVFDAPSEISRTAQESYFNTKYNIW